MCTTKAKQALWVAQEVLLQMAFMRDEFQIAIDSQAYMVAI